jgi:hypothetical protein
MAASVPRAEAAVRRAMSKRAVKIDRTPVTATLYSVRSDRLFGETLDYNILFRWFLDMTLKEPAFDACTFSKNRERLARRSGGKVLRCPVLRRTGWPTGIRAAHRCLPPVRGSGKAHAPTQS